MIILSFMLLHNIALIAHEVATWNASQSPGLSGQKLISTLIVYNKQKYIYIFLYSCHTESEKKSTDTIHVTFTLYIFFFI